jgi:hypothetical protein
MLVSRRTAVAFAAASTVVSVAPARAVVNAVFRRTQLVQHLVVHPDEADGQRICAALALEAPDTAWKTAGMMTERAFCETTASLQHRRYGLRRVNAFQTRRGVRYAAIWQLGRSTPADVRTGMDLATFQATAEHHARNGLAISQLDAAGTDDGARFSAIWERSYTNQAVLADLTESDFALHVASGRAPHLLAGYASGNSARFAAVFGAAGTVRTDLALPASRYLARGRAMKAAGFALRDVSGYAVGGQPFLTAVWQQA